MQHDGSFNPEARYDAVLVGAGIMSATLAALLHELDPQLRILLVERLEAPALESSAAVNNAGTGHAANCELNYTPMQADGTVATAKAVAINASFETQPGVSGARCRSGAISTPAASSTRRPTSAPCGRRRTSPFCGSASAN